jgi:hypothetical protein
MRSISEAISTIIIASTIIMVSLTIFYFAIINLQQSIASSEYGYTKSIFINLATNIPNIINGGSFGANLPRKLVGVGYRDSGRIISIVIGNSTGTLLNYTSKPKALEATIYSPIVTTMHIIYGDPGAYIVNDTSLIPSIIEYYENGAAHLVLDTARVYVRIYVFEINNVKHYIVNILYLELKPQLVSSAPLRIVVSARNTLVSNKYLNIDPYISGITITDKYGTHTYLIKDLIPTLSSSDIVDVNIIIKQLLVVLI